VPGAWCGVRGAWYEVRGARYEAQDTRYVVRGTGYTCWVCQEVTCPKIEIMYLIRELVGSEPPCQKGSWWGLQSSSASNLHKNGMSSAL
jgi:hypothetical protein